MRRWVGPLQRATGGVAESIYARGAREKLQQGRADFWCARSAMRYRVALIPRGGFAFWCRGGVDRLHGLRGRVCRRGVRRAPRLRCAALGSCGTASWGRGAAAARERACRGLSGTQSVFGCERARVCVACARGERVRVRLVRARAGPPAASHVAVLEEVFVPITTTMLWPYPRRSLDLDVITNNISRKAMMAREIQRACDDRRGQRGGE